MAQIESVQIVNIPEYINVGDDESDIDVQVCVEFHPLDIKLEMEYILDIVIVDIHGLIDVPVILANWMDTKVIPVTESSKDKYLGFAKKQLVASSEPTDIILPVTLRLGKLNYGDSLHSRKLDAFATLTPAIGRSSKWSPQFEAVLLH